MRKPTTIMPTRIIPQIPVVKKWYQLFGDSTYADVCLSRITSKAYCLEFSESDIQIEKQ